MNQLSRLNIKCLLCQASFINNKKCIMISIELLFAAEPPKPKFPKKYIEFVDEEAMDWLTNLVDID